MYKTWHIYNTPNFSQKTGTSGNAFLILQINSPVSSAHDA